MNRNAILLLCLVAFVVIVAQFDSWTGQDDEQASISEAPQPVKKTPQYTVIEASSQQAALIRETLEQGLSLRSVHRVRSESHANAWYVGGRKHRWNLADQRQSRQPRNDLGR